MFVEFDCLTDGEIDIKILMLYDGKGDIGDSPMYGCGIYLHNTEIYVGQISLRIAPTNEVIKYEGNIGYGIEDGYRGNRYATKACKLMKHIAIQHGLSKLIITCNPYNIPSRKTCEGLGARLIEIIDVPKGHPLYIQGNHRLCRYEWDIRKEYEDVN